MARRKRPSGLRNLLIVFGIVGVTLAVALWLRTVDRTPPFILPEEFDPSYRMAERDASENAWHGLWKAQDLLPEIPEPLYPSFDEARRAMRETFRPVNPILNNHLGVAFDCPPNEMTAYLLQCEAAATQMYEAMKQPYYLLLFEPPHNLSRWQPLFFDRLGDSMVGYGAVLTHSPDTVKRGMEVLLDCIRLSRMLNSEEGGEGRSRLIEDNALQVLTITARKPQAAPHLDWLQTALDELGPHDTDGVALLHRFWRKVDNTLTYKRPGMSIFRFVRGFEALRETRYRAKRWREHRVFLEDMAAKPVSKHNAMMHGNPAVKVDLDDGDSALWLHMSVLLEAAHQQLYFQRTRIQVAMQRYRLKHAAYPPTLEALAPEFLATVPADPMNGLPLRYVNEGTRIRMYSTGLDETDADGAGDDILLLLIE